MVLTPGTRLGPYEVVSLLGAGGMGQVYRARDTKLNRDVALKILPEAFTVDGDRIARFRREAQVLASLNHPNIASIYGFEDSGSTHALVLELVEGPTLADRIARGPISLDEALPIAKQIAEALEAAHEQGTIHRDLKPANIKVRDDGAVKVLDFGLAKVLESESAISPALPASPTITMPAQMTVMGTLLGTAAYMSPEQAEGRSADKRSDIWAFGCVLYEMLTGTRAFEGDNVSDCVAAILRSEPDWRALPDTTAPVVRKLLRRCLQKDPKQRFGDIRDARLEVVEALAPPEPLSQAVHRRTPLSPVVAVPWALAAVFAAAVAWLATAPARTLPVHRSVTRLDFNLPAGVELFTTNAPAAALSQDGTRLAFVGVLGGHRQLYSRRLDRFETVPLRGIENPVGVFASPDGRALGFITADRTLKTVSLEDGLVTTIEHDADFNVGAAWGVDDRITFGRDGALWQVPATGGRATQLTTLDPGKQDLLHAWPAPIAGGKVLLFTSITGNSREASHIEAFSMTTRQRRVLVTSGKVPLYVSSGHLVFFRDGALLAAPFDIDRLEITGPVVRVVENLAVDATMGAPIAAVSTAGSLVYAPSDAGTTRLVWVSRQGVEQPITDTARRYQSPRLAPDSQRIAVAANGDLWMWDIARTTLTRLTSEGTVGNSFPLWTPDATRVVFRTSTGMQWIAADGSGHPQAIPGSGTSADFPSSVAPDGDTLAFLRQNPDTSGDIYVLSLRGGSKPRPLVNTTAYEGGAQFSPDGRFLAYVSDESGQKEVYVRLFPGPNRRWTVSTEGGTQPLWNRNGREIFYRAGNKMMVVEVSGYPDLTLSQPRLLFDQRYVFQSLTGPTYDISADGQRFLMVKDEAGAGRLNVVLDWFEELKQRVPVK